MYTTFSDRLKYDVLYTDKILIFVCRMVHRLEGIPQSIQVCARAAGNEQ